MEPSTIDYLGEYEPHDTVYTLTVYVPPRPLPAWLPKFLTHQPTHHEDHDAVRDHDITPDPAHTRVYVYVYKRQHLKDMKLRQVKIPSFRFPPDFRCEHVQGRSKSCEQGCYLLEKGGVKEGWNCEGKNCEGHVYVGQVKMDDGNGACFGEKGRRLVAVVA
ncbi:hypothetical protein K504DRAFT_497618 [Pleomassaria siparia CBS 279.74]|uniref:Uncharacterized protein n=1 Tax=Pleomassaria siparia CBS 279.74 TaxID=1314801 RepID=A0A6G1KTV7_9PLEO|nr:hypothetical protein K504DRAFT_497618 [Pleomassaria siparia CBS 279.74]